MYDCGGGVSTRMVWALGAWLYSGMTALFLVTAYIKSSKRLRQWEQHGLCLFACFVFGFFFFFGWLVGRIGGKCKALIPSDDLHPLFARRVISHTLKPHNGTVRNRREIRVGRQWQYILFLLTFLRDIYRVYMSDWPNRMRHLRCYNYFLKTSKSYVRLHLPTKI